MNHRITVGCICTCSKLLGPIGAVLLLTIGCSTSTRYVTPPQSATSDTIPTAHILAIFTPVWDNQQVVGVDQDKNIVTCAPDLVLEATGRNPGKGVAMVELRVTGD